MDRASFEFGADVIALTAQLLPLLAAFGLAFLIRRKAHALLIVVNLWLFMELASTLLAPGYVFASWCGRASRRACCRSRSATAV